MGAGLMVQWVRDAGVWKPIIAMDRRDAGAWKDSSQEDARDAGTWKVFHSPETMLPDGDVSATDWEDATGGDGDGALWDEVDEATPDDATTYIRVQILAETLQSKPVRVTLASAAKDHHSRQEHRLVARIRPHIDTNETDLDFSLTLYQGPTEISAGGADTRTEADDNVWSDVSHVLSSTEAGNITNYGDLELELTVANATADLSAVEADCTWMALEIDSP